MRTVGLSPEEVHDMLAPLYPGVRSRLLESSRGNPVDTLVATILSQATNDNLSSQAFQSLKETFSGWDEVLEGSTGLVENVLQVGGLHREKTAYIKAALSKIKEDFGSVTLDPLLDRSFDECFKYLTSLKGVGPKTAACVLAFGMGKPAFPVDTHVLRIARRLGMVPLKTPAAKAQHILEKVTPEHLKMPLHLMLIEHGRQVCSAAKPKCHSCPFSGLCEERRRRETGA